MISTLNELNCVFNSVDLSMDKRGYNVGICQSSDNYNTSETVNTLYTGYCEKVRKKHQNCFS